MGLFSKARTRDKDRNQDQGDGGAARAREAREDAWRADRRAACARLTAAEREHSAARRVYDRYAPGAEKTAAGARLNTTARDLMDAEAEFEAVNTFQAWSRTH